MPEAFQSFGNAWQTLHPGWQVKDWMASSLLPRLFNQDLFDRVQEIFPKDWKRFQADIVRLELLWNYGGVYVDTDVEPRRPLNDLIAGHACLVGRSPQVKNGVHSITNAVMASAPKHPFIAAAIDRLPASVKRHQGRPLAQVAGPWHLNRTYEADYWPDVAVLEPDELYGGEYFLHHWNNALRKKGRRLG